jgi:hypothetical protein
MASDVRIAKRRDLWPPDPQSKIARHLEQAVARADAHSIAGLLGAALAVLRDGRRGADAIGDALSSGGLYVARRRCALRASTIGATTSHRNSRLGSGTDPDPDGALSLRRE